MAGVNEDLPLDIVKQIAESSGRCYAYEGKRMAQEIMRRRAAELEAARATQLPPLPYSLHP